MNFVSPKNNRIGVIHAYPTRYMVDSLRQAGWSPVLIGPASANLQGQLSGLEVLDIELTDSAKLVDAVCELHRRQPLAGLLPVYEGATVLNAQLAGLLRLRGMPLVAALASRNKFLSNQVWHGAGIPVPRTVPLLDLEQGFRVIEQTIGYPAVLKLADSMNSQGVIKVCDRSEYTQAITRLHRLLERPQDFDRNLDRNRWVYGHSEIKVIAQEYCGGAEVGVDVFVNGMESAVLGMFQKAPAHGPCFAESMSVWPTSLGVACEQDLGALAAAAVRALGVSHGMAHVEIRYADDGARVLEAGLRPGGGYTIRAVDKLTGVNTYQLLAALACGEVETPVVQGTGAMLYGGVVYQRSGRLESVTGSEIFSDIPGLLDLQVLNQPGDAVVALPESAQPHYCYYLLHGDDREAVISHHQRIQQRVQVAITPLP
jgi:S-sulfo-L-cysteine synthase (3-phospho-L-serine-dependent)